MKNRNVSKVGFAVFLIITILYLMPLLVTFTNSLMSSKEVERNYITSSVDDEYIRMALIPEKITLRQYEKLLFDTPIYLYMFWNTIKIVLPIVIGQILVSAPCAYAFTVMKFKGKEILFFAYIIAMLLPLQVTLMPNYIVADWLGIKDSYLSIILPGIFNPFGVFLLRQYMKSIPENYIEAAKIDGAGHLQIFGMIVLPMIEQGIAAVFVLTLLDYWNLVDQAVVFIQDTEKMPLSTFLAGINAGEQGVAFAGSCFYAIPVILLVFYGQKYLRNGISIAGIKG